MPARKIQIGLTSRLRRRDARPAFPGYDLSPLHGQGLAEFSYYDSKPTLEADDLGGYDAVVLLGERIVGSSLPAGGRLLHLARMGVGFDTVDLEACTERDVVVTTTPDAVRRPMAVATLALLLALSTRLMVKDRIARQGPDGWRKRIDHHGRGLIGRTLGLVGIGNIGAEVLRLADPLGMRHIAADPYATAEQAEALGVELVPLDELFAVADVVSLHCPLTEETRHLVDRRRLALMKPTAYLINTARGPVVDQKALYLALAERRIAGAALDVMDPEPSPEDEPLNQLDNVILSPHALGWTEQTWAGMAAIHVAAFRALLAGRAPDNVVNREVLERPGFQAKLGKLAGRG